MFFRSKLLLCGLLCLVYAAGKAWLLHNVTGTALARVSALIPQPLRTLCTLSIGTPVLVEGRISRAVPFARFPLVAYVKSVAESVGANESPVWVPDGLVSPPLLLEAGSAQARVAAGYQQLQPPRQSLEKRAVYNGFDRGAQVFVLGQVGPGGVIQSATVCGGTRAAFLAKHTGKKWVGYAHCGLMALLGLVLLGVKLVFGRPASPARQDH